MRNLAIVGGQWGDEGKGKIIDVLGGSFDVVARFQGGHNAGHSVEVDGTRYALRLVPSGIVRPGKVCVIGNGVVVDPAALVAEIDELAKRGISVKGRLLISNRAHVIFPFHQAFDAAREAEAGGRKIGTTLRGIGPAYLSKSARLGLRIADLLDVAALRRGLDGSLGFWNRVLARGYGQAEANPAAIGANYRRLGRLLRPFVTDTGAYLAREMGRGKAVLFEGAQGALLDVDHGTYPYVTSSSATPGGIGTGLGIPPRCVHGVLGVFKSYATRVGAGPFPTEDPGERGNLLRERGREYGTVTGRPRRCGWFDGVAARYAQRVCGFDAVALTLFDVLDALEEIPVAVGYRYRGSLLKEFPAEAHVLEKVTPVYKAAKGWRSSTRGATRFDALPRRAKDYVRRLEDLIGAPVALVSTGPGRGELTTVRPDLMASLLPARRGRGARR